MWPVVFTPAAEADLLDIGAWVAEQADGDIALSYISRIQARALRLREYPNRGEAKPELGMKVRALSFERRLLILYSVEEDEVLVLRIIGAERDLSDLTL
ncbi:MAG: type II toxin-antitoxin system RelE/ParE family toxin [Pseudomonadota bacterium]